jgi:3-oxoadipate enol-lactonase
MVESEIVSVGDMKVRVSGAGFPLVLVHGFTTTSEFWKEQVDAFSNSYQVIRPNLPGHGISPSRAARAYTVDAFVDDLAQLTRHFSLSRFALVGLSMGGVVSQLFALKYPELLQALVFVDTTAHGLGRDVQAEHVLAAIERIGIARASEDVVAHSFGPGAPQALVDWAKREVIQTPEFVARAAVVSLGQSDTRAQLHRITTPTLVIVGEEDIILPPAESRVLHDEIPNSILTVIEKSGHFPMLEQPHEFNRVLRTFLDQHARVS